jgi:uncharacterized protein YbjT (DUF2867 family)
VLYINFDAVKKSEDDRLYVVFGVTGAQGGAVAASLLAKGATRVRGLTRNPTSDKAKALDKKVEVVKCDMDNEEEIKQALEGAYGVFLVTNFWEHFDANKEVEQVKRVAKIAEERGVKHLVFSTLEDTSAIDAPVVKDGFKTPHFDGKALATKYLQENAKGLGVTQFYTSFYYENFIYFGMAPKLNGAEDGVYRFGMPIGSKPLPMMAIEDCGKAGASALMDDSTIGKSVGIASCHMTGEEIAKAFAEVTDKKVEFIPMTRDQYAGLGFPGCEDLANMFKFKHDYNETFCALRDLKKSKKLTGSELKSFKSWLQDNLDALQKAMQDAE